MGFNMGSDEDQSGFGDPILLNKIDELRRLNIASMVPLPQLVVVGDQSAGKSSVLEGLTGFPFPRAVKLCTRYPTEIICRRDETKNTTITICPQAGASAERVAKLPEFKVDVTDLDPRSSSFQEVFQKAAMTMGIRTGADPDDPAPAFSKDVLRIEISGPDEEHLTIIDVPGIIEVPEPGVTTKDDIPLVKSMVHKYMSETRTIILAVAPCTSDVATQQIFARAEEVDPEGKRTIGVLTKPDLLKEDATRDAIMELVRGDRKPLKLGYFVVKNRGADDTTSSLNCRHEDEREFFSKHPWNQSDRSRLGIAALRLQLPRLLMERTRHEFPKVTQEITTRLKRSKKQLEALGDSRATSDQQRIYLGRIASRFRDLANFATNAYYPGDPMFDKRPETRLITQIREINDVFAKTLFSKGHSRFFRGEKDTEGPSQESTSPTDDDSTTSEVSGESPHRSISRNKLYDVSFDLPNDIEFPELIDLLSEPAFCPDPLDEDITEYIGKINLSARGQELGTFGSSTLSTVFKDQSKKWKDLTLAHVSNAILIVHRFIYVALEEACPDDQVRGRVRSFIIEDLIQSYRRATDHANFLLLIECGGKTLTCNPEFQNNLRATKQLRYQNKAAEVVQSNNGRMPETDAVAAILTNESDADQTCEHLHDVLEAYYEIARSRLVDGIYQQVVDHFMLSDSRSALRVFGPERVLSMTSDELKAIAEEDPSSKRTRDKLEFDIACLKKGMVVLRS